jgi:hypothetical protein
MIQRVLSYGTVWLFRGLREGRPALAGFGAGLSVLAFLRRRRKPARERVYSLRLHEGKAVRIRLLRGKTVVDETEVVGR